MKGFSSYKLLKWMALQNSLDCAIFYCKGIPLCYPCLQGKANHSTGLVEGTPRYQIENFGGLIT